MSLQKLELQIEFAEPWMVSNYTSDILVVEIGSLQLRQKIPPQIYKAEGVLIRLVIVSTAAIIVTFWVISMKNVGKGEVSTPFLKEMLTLLLMVHTLMIEVRLPEVVKMLISELILVLTCDLLNVRGWMREGQSLDNPYLFGYESVSLIANMGLVFW
jgi:hypothetical protein